MHLKLCKEYLISHFLVLYLFLEKIWKLLTSHGFLPLAVAKLSTLRSVGMYLHVFYSAAVVQNVDLGKTVLVIFDLLAVID